MVTSYPSSGPVTPAKATDRRNDFIDAEAGARSTAESDVSIEAKPDSGCRYVGPRPTTACAPKRRARRRELEAERPTYPHPLRSNLTRDVAC
jgi:hypothetical protein